MMLVLAFIELDILRVNDFATYMMSHHVLILLITILQINKGDHFKELVPKGGKFNVQCSIKEVIY